MVLGNGEMRNRKEPTSMLFKEYTSSSKPENLDASELKTINMKSIRERTNRLRAEVMESMEEMVEEYMADIEIIESNICENGGQLNTKQLYRTPDRKKRGEIMDKEFIARKSVLTDLLGINHIRTIYHIFVAILIIFLMNTVVHDVLEKGRISLDFQLIQWCFGKFPLVMSIWCSMQATAILVVYPMYQFWSTTRTRAPSYSWFDLLFLLFYIAYQVSLLIMPVWMIIAHNLPIASAVIILCEQVRFFMKVHAFVRHNIPRTLRYNPEKEDSEENIECPDFSKYLYFLFAPTLVYRDSYPRTPSIHWKYVVSNFAQVFACLIYIYYIFERFCVPVFQGFDREHVTPRRWILAIFGCMMPATLVLFIGFFAVLHSWLNAFAEMLRFGDRMFYKDWWNSSSFSNYYRTWNVVVHDWLYTYIYKDILGMLGYNSRPSAILSVFLLSAIFHEYILSFAFGFFYPVLFVLFAGAGFGFNFLNSKVAPRSGNVFMWVSLFLGNGILMCLYSMEWYARINCKPVFDGFIDYLIPRSWFCVPYSPATFKTVLE